MVIQDTPFPKPSIVAFSQVILGVQAKEIVGVNIWGLGWFINLMGR